MTEKTETRLSTGIAGLDEILHGGLIPGRAYLASGGPGTGKTILGLHFLTAGVAAGEKALLITLEESGERIRQNGEKLGFDLADIAFLDLSPTSEFFTEMQTYDLFAPAEVEREPLSQRIIEQVQQQQPRRVFLDGMTQFRLLSSDSFQFRKQVLSFLRFLSEQGVTLLFSSESSPETPDSDLRFMADGILELSYGREERTVSVTKFRGSDFRPGRHALRLDSNGMQIFPHLIPASHQRPFAHGQVPSGVPELDELLHGGLERGTVTILSGPSGVGKTTLGLQFMKEAAGRGERSVVYTFEEGVEALLTRSERINIPVRSMVERGTLSLIPIEPLRYSPDEFAARVRSEVEPHEPGIVMIDSTSGYGLSFHKEDQVAHLHALCTYLKNMGTTVILVNEVETITGDFRITEMGISYLADNILILCYVEQQGELSKMISVLKKRLSDFDKKLRPLQITRYGIKVGEPLENMRGLLTGTPELTEPDEAGE